MILDVKGITFVTQQVFHKIHLEPSIFKNQGLLPNFLYYIISTISYLFKRKKVSKNNVFAIRSLLVIYKNFCSIFCKLLKYTGFTYFGILIENNYCNKFLQTIFTFSFIYIFAILKF